jgi:hypothetical protein
MTNPNAPFGFRFVKMIDGTVPNYGIRRGFIKGGGGGNSNSIFSGDVLKPSSAGFLDVQTVTSGGELIGGIAESFEWVSLSQGKTVRQLYWPGTPTDVAGSGNVIVNYYSNPGCIFEVQCTTGPVTVANVGQFANFAVGSGGKTTGAGNYSSFTLNDSTLTDTQGYSAPGTTTPVGGLPFRVYAIPGYDPSVPGFFSQPGYDPSSAYNRVWVTMAMPGALTPE